MIEPIIIPSGGKIGKRPYRMPIRRDITVLPADPLVKMDIERAIIITSKGITQRKTNKVTLGWKVKETIGIAVVNTRGVSKGRKSVIIG